MIDLSDLHFFRTVAKSASLSDAARHLGVSPPAVSQRLSALENRMGLALINRGPNGLGLTGEGAELLQKADPLLNQADALMKDLFEKREALSGPVRILAPFGYGRLNIAPLVGTFAKAHPDISPDLFLSDHPRRHMGDETWDIVVNVGRLPDLSATQTVLCRNKRLLCASPTYLASVGHPEHPSHLSSHRCGCIQEDAADVTHWRFSSDDGLECRVRFTPAFRSNDGEVVRAWALDGLGIVERSEWSVRDDIDRGRLLRVLPEWSLPDADVVAIVQPSHLRPKKVTALLNHLREGLSNT
ncbi:DNA-binding transcriptional LysR family regulator [Shimia isoporae]|uniref:DNA-binding transcriptional LysR family regulator n=1 Tax=Shimia isoporae TaxID=647720 RepID=A0A4R1N1T0_9RHOB|nr:LysR family transcriptional regulator [Shimia isoporae]TCL00310.1 DNA-binding transcriptional LysR family regulator [Shimia isoporae]